LSNLSKETIASTLVQKGPLGVTQLATELDLPVSTLHRYLTNQKYFKQTENRKWDIPENFEVATELNTLTKMANNVHASVDLLLAQHEDLTLRITGALDALKILMKGIETFDEKRATKSNKEHPVADSRLVDMDKGSKSLREAVKQNKSNIPSEYYELLYNYDFISHVLTTGRDIAKDFLEKELAPIILDGDLELSEETVETLKEYQQNG
jgi:hypothetical protein